MDFFFLEMRVLVVKRRTFGGSAHSVFGWCLAEPSSSLVIDTWVLPDRRRPIFQTRTTSDFDWTWRANVFYACCAGSACPPITRRHFRGDTHNRRLIENSLLSVSCCLSLLHFCFLMSFSPFRFPFWKFCHGAFFIIFVFILIARWCTWSVETLHLSLRMFFFFFFLVWPSEAAKGDVAIILLVGSFRCLCSICQEGYYND